MCRCCPWQWGPTVSLQRGSFCLSVQLGLFVDFHGSPLANNSTECNLVGASKREKLVERYSKQFGKLGFINAFLGNSDFPTCCDFSTCMMVSYFCLHTPSMSIKCWKLMLALPLVVAFVINLHYNFKTGFLLPTISSPTSSKSQIAQQQNEPHDPKAVH